MIISEFYATKAVASVISVSTVPTKISFQGNKIISIDGEKYTDQFDGMIFLNYESHMGSYYIVLHTGLIYNVSKLDPNTLWALIQHRELISSFESLKLAIEAALL